MRINQKGFNDVVVVTIIGGIIGALFITGVFVWQEVKIQKLTNKIYVQKSPSIDDIDIEKLIENCNGVWQFGKCVPLNCKDSDAELNLDDIYNKGYVATLDDKGEPLVSWDKCNSSGSQVIEGWCTDNGLGGALVYNCPNGCVEGACLKSEDAVVVNEKINAKLKSGELECNSSITCSDLGYTCKLPNEPICLEKGSYSSCDCLDPNKEY